MAQILVLCGNLAKYHYKPWEMCILEFKVNHFKGIQLRVTLIKYLKVDLKLNSVKVFSIVEHHLVCAHVSDLTGWCWWVCFSDTCADMFLYAVWIPLSDSLHHRSCYHCNKKPDMSILVMDAPTPHPHPLHHHHHKLTHLYPSMKTWHLQALLEFSVSSHGSAFSAESDILIVSKPSPQPLRPRHRHVSWLTLSALKLHANTWA